MSLFLKDLTSEEREELEAAVSYGVGEIIGKLQEMGMFHNPKCPDNRRFMTDEEYSEVESVGVDAILGH